MSICFSNFIFFFKQIDCDEVDELSVRDFPNNNNKDVPMLNDVETSTGK